MEWTCAWHNVLVYEKAIEESQFQPCKNTRNQNYFTRFRGRLDGRDLLNRENEPSWKDAEKVRKKIERVCVQESQSPVLIHGGTMRPHNLLTTGWGRADDINATKKKKNTADY